MILSGIPIDTKSTNLLSVPLHASITNTTSQLCMYSDFFVARVAEFIIKNANVDTSAFTSAGVADPFAGTSVALGVDTSLR